MAARASHPFRFFRAGNVDQVLLRNRADLAHLAQLDRKHWMALTMPTTGIEFDPRTAAMIDTDHDGRLRPPEIIAAVDWALRSFKDAEALFEPSDSVPLPNIADAELLAGARRILASLQKPDATEVTVADVTDTTVVVAGMALNGDGVMIPKSPADPKLRAGIEDLLRVVDSLPDRSGKPGLDQGRIDEFFAEAVAYESWAQRGHLETPALLQPGRGDRCGRGGDRGADQDQRLLRPLPPGRPGSHQRADAQ